MMDTKNTKPRSLIYKNDVNFAIKDLNYCKKIDTIIIGMNWYNFKQKRKWRADNE